MCQVGHGKWWHWDRGLKISIQVRDVVWVRVRAGCGRRDSNEGQERRRRGREWERGLCAKWGMASGGIGIGD